MKLLRYSLQILLLSALVNLARAREIERRQLPDAKQLVLSGVKNGSVAEYTLELYDSAGVGTKVWQASTSEPNREYLELKGFTAVGSSQGDVTVVTTTDDFGLLMIQADLKRQTSTMSYVSAADLFKKSRLELGEIKVVGPGKVAFTSGRTGQVDVLERRPDGSFTLNGAPYGPAGETSLSDFLEEVSSRSRRMVRLEREAGTLKARDDKAEVAKP